jgi:hypothetical protein
VPPFVAALVAANQPRVHSGCESSGLQRTHFGDLPRKLKGAREGGPEGSVMDWARILAHVTGSVDQELLARNECLAIENCICMA